MSIREQIKQKPKFKKFLIKIIFRPEPNSSKVRFWLWLFMILPYYLKRGISWRSRLDLAPFNKFKTGKRIRIEMGTVINNGLGDVIMHDDTRTGIGSIVIGPVVFHKYATIAQYTRIIGMRHGIDAERPHLSQPNIPTPIVLEEDAFIGTGAVVMGKKDGSVLTIGKYSRVAANSVVYDDVPAYSIVAGCPAKVIKVWDFIKKKWVKTEDYEIF